MTNDIRRRPGIGLLTLIPALTLAAAGCQDETTSPTTAGPAPAITAAASAPLSFRQLSAGRRHTCGVTTDDRAYCWGDNATGQLGDGTSADRGSPVAVSGGLRFILVSAGGGYTCGLTTGERAYCWGENTAGQLGDGTTTNRPRPVPVAGGRRFRQVRAGHLHTCAVNPFGVGFCWGGNSNGQLGDNTRTNRLTPVRVNGGLAFRRIFPAGVHTCGVTTVDLGYCWGRNEDGQLGDETTIQKLKPTAVDGGHSFSQVLTGAGQGNGTAWSSVSCGVTTENRAFCWGENRFGALGDGTSGFGVFRIRPVAVLGGLLFSAVSTGGAHTCGITTTNLAYCWGSDGNHQLGDGNAQVNDRSTPGAVVGGLRFRAITAGTLHSCGITITDQAYCWGINFDGQLGIGTIDVSPFTPKSSPRPVVGPA